MKKILLLIAVLPFFNQKNVNAQCSFNSNIVGFKIDIISNSPRAFTLNGPTLESSKWTNAISILKEFNSNDKNLLIC